MLICILGDEMRSLSCYARNYDSGKYIFKGHFVVIWFTLVTIYIIFIARSFVAKNSITNINKNNKIHTYNITSNNHNYFPMNI